MGDWLSVVLLVGCGIILIILELIFVPGTTILGVLGFLMLLGGVVVSFASFGATTGWIVLVGTAIVGLISVIYSLKSGVWQRFSLKSQIDSRVNEHEKDHLQIGMRGKAVSDLRPVGTAEFEDKLYEVQTNGNYLDSGKAIEIIKLSDNKIIVQPI